MRKKYLLPRNQRYYFYILYNVYPASIAKLNITKFRVAGFPINDPRFRDLLSEISGLENIMKEYLEQVRHINGERISYVLYSKDEDDLAYFYSFLTLLRPSRIFLWISFETQDTEFAAFEPLSRNLLGPLSVWKHIFSYYDSIRKGDLFHLDEDDIPYVNLLLEGFKALYKGNKTFPELMGLYARAYGEEKNYFKYLLFIMIIESLIEDTDYSSIAYKIRRMCAVLIGTSLEQSINILKGATEAYGIRSKMVHTSKLDVDRNILQFVHSMVCEILLLLLVTGIEKKEVFPRSTPLGFGLRKNLITDKRFKRFGLISKNAENLKYPFPEPPKPPKAKVSVKLE